ncbi:MAG: esterase-like activity of phytase family protein [Myxococcota bacterium]
MRQGLFIVIGLAACYGHTAAQTLDHPLGRSAPAMRSQRLSDQRTLGLSGLDVDEHGVYWSVPEHRRELLQLDRHGVVLKTLGNPRRIVGVPKHFELESIAALGGQRFVLGTELKSTRDADTLFFAHIKDDTLVVTNSVKLSYAAWAMQATSNHGIEGLCATKNHLVAVSESVHKTPGHRLAPLWLMDRDAAVQRHFSVQLTTSQGKLSALHCAPEAVSGQLNVWAIERHFGVGRILSFAIPIYEALSSAPVEIPTTVEVDLVHNNQPIPNFEGLAREDGTFIFLNDNDSAGRNGDNWMISVQCADAEAEVSVYCKNNHRPGGGGH